VYWFIHFVRNPLQIADQKWAWSCVVHHQEQMRCVAAWPAHITTCSSYRFMTIFRGQCCTATGWILTWTATACLLPPAALPALIADLAHTILAAVKAEIAGGIASRRHPTVLLLTTGTHKASVTETLAQQQLSMYTGKSCREWPAGAWAALLAGLNSVAWPVLG